MITFHSLHRKLLPVYHSPCTLQTTVDRCLNSVQNIYVSIFLSLVVSISVKACSIQREASAFRLSRHLKCWDITLRCHYFSIQTRLKSQITWRCMVHRILEAPKINWNIKLRIKHSGKVVVEVIDRNYGNPGLEVGNWKIDASCTRINCCGCSWMRAPATWMCIPLSD